MKRVTRSLTIVGTAALLIAIAIPASAATSRVSLANSGASFAQSSNLAGKPSATRSITFHVALGWRNQASLANLIAAVSDPRSSSYGHYLSAQQFISRFAPSSAQSEAVASWLKSQGLTVISIPKDRLYVRAQGTVAQIERAFKTAMNLYRTPQGTRFAPSVAPSVPASLKGIVTAVTGLAQFEVSHHHVVLGAVSSKAPSAVPPPALFRNAPPCSKYWAQLIDNTDPPAYGVHQPYVPCGAIPGTLRNVYMGSTTLDGTGQTVAIIDAFASPSIVKDARTWSQKRGLPAPHLTQTVFPPDVPVDSGWWQEETLDVEAVHGMAPGAAIHYVGAADNGTGIDDAQNYVVENELATIVSNSYGYLGEVNQAIRDTEDAIYKMAIATGIGFFFSSGDDGDNSLIFGQATPNWPASSANVTAVGGTSLATTNTRQYNFETYWGTDKSTLTNNVWTPTPPGTFLYGAGGGTSHVINEPAYQVGVVPVQFSSRWGGSRRVVPDISLDGDPNTGYQIGETQTFPDNSYKYSEFRIGGTSLSAPLMAGLMAVINQGAGRTLGFINPALYELYANNPAAFRDVSSGPTPIAVTRVDYVNGYNGDAGTTTSLRTMDDTLTLSSIPGWDDATGPGSPNGLTFIQGLPNP